VRGADGRRAARRCFRDREGEGWGGGRRRQLAAAAAGAGAARERQHALRDAAPARRPRPDPCLYSPIALCGLPCARPSAPLAARPPPCRSLWGNSLGPLVCDCALFRVLVQKIIDRETLSCSNFTLQRMKPGP